jgi:hypothetical protein
VKIPMIVRTIKYDRPHLQYELISVDEKYSVRFVMDVNQAYKPDWKPGEQIVIELPEQSETPPPLPQRLREVAG